MIKARHMKRPTKAHAARTEAERRELAAQAAVVAITRDTIAKGRCPRCKCAIEADPERIDAWLCSSERCGWHVRFAGDTPRAS